MAENASHASDEESVMDSFATNTLSRQFAEDGWEAAWRSSLETMRETNSGPEIPTLKLMSVYNGGSGPPSNGSGSGGGNSKHLSPLAEVRTDRPRKGKGEKPPLQDNDRLAISHTADTGAGRESPPCAHALPLSARNAPAVPLAPVAPPHRRDREAPPHRRANKGRGSHAAGGRRKARRSDDNGGPGTLAPLQGVGVAVGGDYELTQRLAYKLQKGVPLEERERLYSMLCAIEGAYGSGVGPQKVLPRIR